MGAAGKALGLGSGIVGYRGRALLVNAGGSASGYMGLRLAMKTVVIRTFMASAGLRKAKLGPLPTFQPTTSPALDSLLDSLREDLFIPPHLLKRHRELIYRPKNHHVLTEEPIYYNIGEHSIHLQPKSKFPSLPLSRFTKALHLLQTDSTNSADYKILPDLVLGFAQAKCPLQPKHCEQLVRTLSQSGQLPILINEILPAASINGFKLTMPSHREIARGIYLQLLASYNKPSAVSALKLLRRYRDLLAYNSTDLFPNFLSSGDGAAGSPLAHTSIIKKYTHDPPALATFCLIHAMECKMHHDSLDHDLYLSKLTDRLIKALTESEHLQKMAKLQVEPSEESLEKNSEKAIKQNYHIVKNTLIDHEFLLKGMSLSQTILQNTITHMLNPPSPSPSTDPSTTTPPSTPPSLPTSPSNLPATTRKIITNLQSLVGILTSELPKLTNIITHWRAYVHDNVNILGGPERKDDSVLGEGGGLISERRPLFGEGDYERKAEEVRERNFKEFLERREERRRTKEDGEGEGEGTEEEAEGLKA